MTVGKLFGGLFFGVIGIAAFLYGKRQASWKAMTIGIALGAYPYFVSNALAFYAIGVALVIALFIFRD